MCCLLKGVMVEGRFFTCRQQYAHMFINYYSPESLNGLPEIDFKVCTKCFFFLLFYPYMLCIMMSINMYMLTVAFAVYIFHFLHFFLFFPNTYFVLLYEPYTAGRCFWRNFTNYQVMRGWLQYLHIGLWSDRLRKDLYYDGEWAKTRCQHQVSHLFSGMDFGYVRCWTYPSYSVLMLII